MFLILKRSSQVRWMSSTAAAKKTIKEHDVEKNKHLLENLLAEGRRAQDRFDENLAENLLVRAVRFAELNPHRQILQPHLHSLHDLAMLKWRKQEHSATSRLLQKAVVLHDREIGEGKNRGDTLESDKTWLRLLLARSFASSRHHQLSIRYFEEAAADEYGMLRLQEHIGASSWANEVILPVARAYHREGTQAARGKGLKLLQRLLHEDAPSISAVNRVDALRLRGLMIRSRGVNVEEALTVFTDALSLAMSHQLAHKAATLFYELGKTSVDVKNVEEAVAYFLKSALWNKNSGNFEGQAYAALQAAHAIEVLGGDSQRAVNFLKSGWEISNKIKNYSLQCEALRRLIHTHNKMQDMRSALYYEKMMVDLVKERAGQSSGLALELRNVANRLIQLGEVRRAVKHLQDGLKIVGDFTPEPFRSKYRADLLCTMSFAFIQLKEMALATEFSLAGLEALSSDFSSMKDFFAACRNDGFTVTRSLVRLLHNVGLSKSDEGEHEEAKLYLEEAYAYAEKLRSQSLQAMVAGSLGLIYTRLNAEERGSATMQKALAIALSSPHGSSHVQRTFGLLGQAKLRAGEYDVAKKLFQQQMTYATRNRDCWGKASAMFNLCQLYLFSKKFDKAIDLLQSHISAALQLEQRSTAAISLEYARSLSHSSSDDSREFSQLASQLEEMRSKDPMLKLKP